MSVFFVVGGEGGAGPGIGPGDGGRGAVDVGHGMQIGIAAGAGDDVGERSSVRLGDGEALVVVHVAGEDKVRRAACCREGVGQELTHRLACAVVCISGIGRVMQRDDQRFCLVRGGKFAVEPIDLVLFDDPCRDSWCRARRSLPAAP